MSDDDEWDGRAMDENYSSPPAQTPVRAPNVVALPPLPGLGSDEQLFGAN